MQIEWERDYEVVCVGDVSCLFQNKGNKGCGKVQLVRFCGLLGMGDSLGRGRGSRDRISSS